MVRGVSNIQQRQEPRVSVNKLGEYVHCLDASRRRKIVFDAKNPSEVQVTRYKEVRQGLIDCIKTNYDLGPINSTLDALREKVTRGGLAESDRQCSIEALEQISVDCLPDLKYITDIRGTSVNTKLIISGVEVSVKPDLILRGEYKGTRVLGAFKFHVSKGFRLNEQARQTVATILQQYLEEHIAKDGEIVKPGFCFSYDVFEQAISCAPQSFKTRRAKIAASCEEFALWWDRV